MKILAVSDLKKRYGDKVVLNGLNLLLEKGEIFGLLGENGAGKTTLMKCILSLTDFESGKIEMDARNIGFIPETYSPWDYLTGREYISLVASILGTPVEKLDEILREYPKILQFDDILDKPIFTYSKGNREKILVTMAFGPDPEIIFFDEPFSGLDPTVAKAEREIMKRFCKDGGTIFMNTHHLELAEKVCSRIGIIRDGRIVFEGKMEEIIQSGGLERVYFEYYPL